MRKLKKLISKWWFEGVIKPYMLKHKPTCTMALKDAIVYQMWSGNIRFSEVNKWLFVMNHPTIKGYVMTPKGPRLFYVMPEGDRKREIENAHGTIIQIL